VRHAHVRRQCGGAARCDEATAVSPEDTAARRQPRHMRHRMTAGTGAACSNTGSIRNVAR